MYSIRLSIPLLFFLRAVGRNRILVAWNQKEMEIIQKVCYLTFFLQ